MLLDTSGLLCVLDSKERFHNEATRLFDSAKGILTHSYILAELIALAQSRGVPRLLTLNFAARIMASPDIQTIWVDAALHEQAIYLLANRLDKSYSLCDAVSFVLMRQHGISDALTTDLHFEQEGFNRLLK